MWFTPSREQLPFHGAETAVQCILILRSHIQSGGRIGMINFYYDINSAKFIKTPMWLKSNISIKLLLLLGQWRAWYGAPQAGVVLEKILRGV